MRTLAVLAWLLLLGSPAGAATIQIVNLDGPNEGFNDPTPAVPVGGNPGTTIGEQRLQLFRYAADIWGALLPSPVTIRVEARFNPQSCDASSAVLGSAAPVEVLRDFPGAEVTGTWYHAALANKLAGVDLAPTNDISTTFNSAIDNNDDCLAGTNWYYGFDGNEGGDVELLPVLLHELGHGLGFSTLVNLTSGAELMGAPDLYETFLLDTTSGQHWDEMTSTQRSVSAVNTDHVVWDGPATTFGAQFVLAGTPTLFVRAPASLPATFPLGTATFGPMLTEAGISGDLVLMEDGVATPTDGCDPLLNPGELAGRIAVVDRGTCTFVTKALAAEAAGAIAVIVVDNVSGGALTLGGADPGLTIPSVSLTLEDGAALKAEMALGTVNVTLALDPRQFAGADPLGRMKVFAPKPAQAGSSISHWDPSALPNLLMEPAITGSLSADVDLTLKHFEDLGWLDRRITAAPEAVGSRLSLAQNLPNPFNPSTTISFEIDQSGPVRLSIFDLRGRAVRTLVQGTLAAGVHTASWDGTDDAGAPVVSGVYLYRLRTTDLEETRRMLLLR